MPSADKIRLKLFVIGDDAASQKAIHDLRSICERHLPGKCDLTIIDVRKNPEMAERHRVIAVPSVLKEMPPPARRIIGDLANADRVLFGLGLVVPGG